MDGRALSWREQRILAAIEEQLRVDSAELDEELRRMRPTRRHRIADAVGRIPVSMLLLLAAASSGLCTAAALLHTVPVLAISGPLLVIALVLLAPRCRRLRVPRPG